MPEKYIPPQEELEYYQMIQAALMDINVTPGMSKRERDKEYAEWVMEKAEFFSDVFYPHNRVKMLREWREIGEDLHRKREFVEKWNAEVERAKKEGVREV